ERQQRRGQGGQRRQRRGQGGRGQGGRGQGAAGGRDRSADRVRAVRRGEHTGPDRPQGQARRGSAARTAAGFGPRRAERRGVRRAGGPRPDGRGGRRPDRDRDRTPPAPPDPAQGRSGRLRDGGGRGRMTRSAGRVRPPGADRVVITPHERVVG